MNTEIGERLRDALETLETTQPTSFEAAFEFLAGYLPGRPPAHDQDLVARFRRVTDVIVASKDRLRLRNNLRTKRTPRECKGSCPT